MRGAGGGYVKFSMRYGTITCDEQLPPGGLRGGLSTN